MKKIISIYLALTVFSLTGFKESLRASDLYGRNDRPPTEVRTRKKAIRYRPAAKTATADCDCNPGVYSVIYLTGREAELQLSDVDTVAMAQKDMRFKPSMIVIGVGSSVDFPNLDPFFHNVFSYSKTEKFDLGKYPQGSTSLVTFDRPGLVQVFCEIHSSMRAYVHVLETPYFAVSDKLGNFTIKGVAPGEYTLHLWQENLPDYTQPITIEGDSLFIKIQP